MEVSIKANGKIYKGWENISISKNIQSMANSFSMSIKQGTFEIDENTLITILKDNKPFLVGYCDNINITISDTKMPMSINGRSKSKDLIDCNISENKQYLNLNAVQIINDLTRNFNIKTTSNIFLEKLSNFNTEVGETYFNAINRLCKQLNILPVSLSNGDLLLTKNKNIVSGPILKKFKSLTFDRNFQDRYSEYIYKKESIVVDVTDGIIKDSDIIRYRPFVAVNTEDKNNIDLAKWKKNNDISNSIVLNGEVVGWDLEINTIVKIETEIVNGYFLISSIEYEKGENGTISKVKFIDRNLFT